MRAGVVPLVFLLAFVCAGCAPPVDLTRGLQVAVLDTGWYDAGIVNGQNKLVPSITLTLKNVSDQRLSALQLNALFRRVTENDEWGQAFTSINGYGGLAPGATTEPLMLKSDRGYTGRDQSRQEMLQNTHFVDAKVQLFAKYGSVQWVRIGEYPVKRQLIAK